MKKITYVILGALIGASVIASVPTLAAGTQKLFEDSVVFQKIINIKKGIKNTSGSVTIKDNLRVTGDLDLEGGHNITVDAADVMITTDNPQGNTPASYLESTDLQSALDDELAIDLATLLPGTTWTVENVTSDDTYNGFTGQVSFTADAMIVDEGRIAAFGLTHPDTDSICDDDNLSDVVYTLYSTNLLYASWTAGEFNDENTVVVTVFADDTDTLGLVGAGGCGEVGIDRISILTRVQE